ncbi:MAG: redoxin domain-containing protein [Gemmatimonadetes bacterium]|nr:redoxin domain-containing protein [Gemmatimonadota bacterium]
MPQETALGPTDGFDLSPTDLDRVQEGDNAPDFTLTSLAGPPVTLSDFRGSANVILVFYRGHW